MTTNTRPCSVADALAVIGEKYSLLVLREVFFGVRRFDAMARNIGAPRDVLTARLKHLVDAGVLARVQYSERPPRYEYRLTEAGRELRPVLVLLTQWGDRYARRGQPPTVFEHACGTDLDAAIVCRNCGHEVVHGDITARFTTPGWTLAGPS